MRDFNEGIDWANNAWLAALPTANTLYAIRIDQQEADLDPTITFTQLTQTASTATKTKAGLSSVARVIDTGSTQWTEIATTTSRAVALLDRAPGGTTPKVLVVQNLTDGSAWDDTVNGPVIVDDLSFRLGYQGET